METLEHHIYLSLGSNLGDKAFNINTAIGKISEFTNILQRSSIYESKAWGYDSENSFYNCCLQIETNKSPSALLQELKKIETDLGRVHSTGQGYQDRIVDIDIILYGNIIITDDDLVIPHPLYKKRSFVLIPLNEIAPTVPDPIDFLTIAQHTMNLPDKNSIIKVLCE